MTRTMPSLSRIKDRLLQRFVRDPAGMGRPVAKEAFDQEYRSGNWDHFGGLEELPRNLVLAGLVAEAFKLPSILDAGCGSGRLAKIYQAHPFARYTGIDISNEGLKKARSLGLSGVEFHHADFETWRPDGSLDAIIFNESIGYARDPAETLRAFSFHLMPGGLFFISHYRFGHHDALWRRIERICEVGFATSVRNDNGKVWDIKMLCPRPTPLRT
jgi:SAM-dependent methyltransferase